MYNLKKNIRIIKKTNSLEKLFGFFKIHSYLLNYPNDLSLLKKSNPFLSLLSCLSFQ